MKKSWKDLKKQGLMDVVVRVISREGLDGLTMDALAEEAGVAKGTLYSYFKNKQDLIREAIEAIVTPVFDELMQILNSELPPQERLKRMSLRHLEYFEQHRDFFRIFVHDRLAAEQRIRRYKSCRYKEFLDATARVLDQGMEQGMFRKVDSSRLASMIVEAEIAIIRHRLLSDQARPVEADASLITDVFLHGIQRAQ